MSEVNAKAPAGTSKDPIVQPQKKEMTAKEKRNAIIGGIVGVVLFVIYILYRILAGNSAQKDVDYVVEVCEKHGVVSQECKDAQKERHVNCTLTECTKTY